MVKSVSKEWVRENVCKLTAFGGKITLDDLDDLPESKGGGYEYKILGDHHMIYIPGIGWATICLYNAYGDYDDGYDY